MRLNQSYIFKENVNITFTYKDRTDNSFFKNKNVFQSVIFSKPNDVRGPLAQVTKHVAFENNMRSNRILAQSMFQQNCQSMINRDFYEDNVSVGDAKQNGLAKLDKLRPKQVTQEIEQTSIQDFEIGELLGKGALGNVYVCRHKQTGFFFAIKKIKKKTVTDIDQLVNSIKIHMFLNQPNIVKLYSVFDDQEHIYLLMELCTDGNLKSQAKSIKNPKQTKKFILGIAYGLRHLHTRNIRHGDIKLENIMCSYGMAKIADFDCISYGKGRNTAQRKENNKMFGSMLYFSPEMIRESILGLNDDVWSLGIICYQILCGYYPFEISSPSEIFNILSKELKPFPTGTDQFLEQLTRKMLSKRVCERPKLPWIIKELQRD